MVETTDNDRCCGHAASPMTYVQLSRASRGDDVFARRVHSEKRIASVWRLSVCPSVCLFLPSFSFLIRLLQHNAPSDSPGAAPADNAARVRFGPCVIGVTLVSRTVVPPRIVTGPWSAWGWEVRYLKSTRNEIAPIQLARCRFHGLAISSATISISFSNKLHASNCIEQHSETVNV